MELSFNINLDDDNYGRIYVTSVENLNKIVECFRKTCEGMTCIKGDKETPIDDMSMVSARKIHRCEIEVGPVTFEDGTSGKFIVLAGHLRTKTSFESAKEHCAMNIGFRLPTKEELDLIIKHKDLIDSVDLSSKGKFSDIGNDWIWSSSEYNSDRAWIQRPSGGYQDGGNKSADFWVIPFMRVDS